MTHKSFPKRIFEKIQLLDREGSVNRVIAETAAHYSRLGPVRPELLEKIAHYLEKCATFISPQSIEALKGFPDGDLEHAGITAVLHGPPWDAPPSKPGTICFPVVTSRGLAREIRLADSAGAVLAPHRLEMLDQVGSPVFRVLREKLKRIFLWRPERYHYVILDAFETEDPNVAGDSLCLPLALALYSHLTQTPVPSDLSATGRVMRDGSILPITGLKKKHQALKEERWFVRRVLVSEQQETAHAVPGIELIKVKTIDQAIATVFPSRAVLTAIPAEIDVDTELKKTEKQYESYLIDTCIENTGELIRYLESGQCPTPKETAVPALFTCYWRRGSCYCHKGNVKETEANLEKSKRLFEKFRGLIHENDYWDSRINFAVLLKDIFRYGEAENLHGQIQEKIEQIGGLDHEKGKNLSTLSQLYVAQGRFLDAARLQKRAIRLIREEERHRNYGYLAQGYMRAGELKKAAYSLAAADELLKRPGVKDAAKAFYAWIFSEYLYRHGSTLKAPGKRHWAKFEQIISRHPEITWYVPGLIHKFAGLAMMDQGDEAGGLQKLNQVIVFFDAQLSPVLRLLGATVRVERSLYFLQKARPKEIVWDLKKINECLGSQKYIKRFFHNERKEISRYLSFKKPGEKGILFQVLNALKNKIPY